MSSLGIELNDAAIIGVGEDGTLFGEPGCALLDEQKAIFGAEVQKIARLQPRQVHNRYWQDLSEAPLTRPAGEFQTQADLAQAQLERLWVDHGAGCDNVYYAVPAYWSKDQLGLLLGISEELQMPVAGLADSAVAASRKRYDGRDLIHLEASLHALTMTRLDQDPGASIADRERVEGVGVDALERAAVEFIAQQFLEQSRFDALHNAKSEQAIYNNLYAWLGRLNRQDRLPLEVTYNDYEFRADVETRDLRDHLRQRCQPVVQRLRSMLVGGRPTALQLGARLSDFPGVVDTLLQIPDCAVYALEPGAAARGVLRRHRNLPVAAGGLKLITTLPWDQPPVPFDDSAAGVPSGETATPTHILYQGKAYRLGAQPFSIGSELQGGVNGLAVGGPNSAISRRHCTVQTEQGRVIVHDHSRFGTYLNGYTIDGSAILQQGDVLGVGKPVREFQLIAEVDSNGA